MLWLFEQLCLVWWPRQFGTYDAVQYMAANLPQKQIQFCAVHGRRWRIAASMRHMAHIMSSNVSDDHLMIDTLRRHGWLHHKNTQRSRSRFHDQGSITLAQDGCDAELLYMDKFGDRASVVAVSCLCNSRCAVIKKPRTINCLLTFMHSLTFFN